MVGFHPKQPLTRSIPAITQGKKRFIPQERGFGQGRTRPLIKIRIKPYPSHEKQTANETTTTTTTKKGRDEKSTGGSVILTDRVLRRTSSSRGECISSLRYVPPYLYKIKIRQISTFMAEPNWTHACKRGCNCGKIVDQYC